MQSVIISLTTAAFMYFNKDLYHFFFLLNTRNPYDISRRELLTQIRRMRVNFLKAALTGHQLQETETLFRMSVQEMGNYQEYLKRLPQPLREIETQPARQHTFGNPFKVNKVNLCYGLNVLGWEHFIFFFNFGSNWLLCSSS